MSDADMRKKAIKALDRDVEKKSHAAGVAAYEEFMEAAANVGQLGGSIPAEMRFAKAWAKEIVAAMEAAGVVFGAASAGWRDIESAPKDGTNVLMWRDGWPHPQQTWWNEKRQAFLSLYGMECWPSPSIGLPARLWMPLPAPPKGSDDESE